MSKTSATVKNAWNTKNYDRIVLTVKAGEKERIKQAASGKSVNRFIIECINTVCPCLLSVLDDGKKKAD